MKFKNIAPEDKEWTAHIAILNDWTPDVRMLRHIIAYIRSGPHYPKHMHQDLINQYFEQKPRTWWVIDKDRPKESERIAGPFTTASDAGVCREIIERTSDHTYWLVDYPA